MSDLQDAIDFVENDLYLAVVHATSHSLGVVMDAARKWEAHLAKQAEIREALGIDYDAPLTLTWSEGAKEPAG